MSTRYQYIRMIEYSGGIPSKLFDEHPWEDHNSARGHLGEAADRYYGKISGKNVRIDWSSEGLEISGRSRRGLNRLVWEIKRRIAVQKRR